MLDWFWNWLRWIGWIFLMLLICCRSVFHQMIIYISSPQFKLVFLFSRSNTYSSCIVGQFPGNCIPYFLVGLSDLWTACVHVSHWSNEGQWITYCKIRIKDKMELFILVSRKFTDQVIYYIENRPMQVFFISAATRVCKNILVWKFNAWNPTDNIMLMRFPLDKTCSWRFNFCWKNGLVNANGWRLCYYFVICLIDYLCEMLRLKISSICMHCLK